MIIQHQDGTWHTEIQVKNGMVHGRCLDTGIHFWFVEDAVVARVRNPPPRKVSR